MLSSILTPSAAAVNPAGVILDLPELEDHDQLQAEQGFEPGSPAHVTADTIRADERAYRRMKCQQCGARNRQCRFYHRGRHYRIVAVCRRCRHGETV